VVSFIRGATCLESSPWRDTFQCYHPAHGRCLRSVMVRAICAVVPTLVDHRVISFMSCSAFLYCIRVVAVLAVCKDHSDHPFGITQGRINISSDTQNRARSQDMRNDVQKPALLHSPQDISSTRRGGVYSWMALVSPCHHAFMYAVCTKLNVSHKVLKVFHDRGANGYPCASSRIVCGAPAHI